jgi:selenium-binding protein 1
MLIKSNRKKNLLLWVAVMALIALIAMPASASNNSGFSLGLIVEIDGEDYRWEPVPFAPTDYDIVGHYWVQAGPKKLVAKHYNTDKAWSDDAPEGELLYIAQVLIDEWTPEKAARYASRGYVHYHEFLRVSDGEPHPTKIGWFKHIAVTNFTLKRGPVHDVTPGVDYEFIPNWTTPYAP